jgi:hypothetical protein
MSYAVGVRKQYPPLGVPSLTSESLAPGEIVTANFDAGLDLTVLPELSRRPAGRARDGVVRSSHDRVCGGLSTVHIGEPILSSEVADGEGLA